jgi:hypothetical protein
MAARSPEELDCLFSHALSGAGIRRCDRTGPSLALTEVPWGSSWRHGNPGSSAGRSTPSTAGSAINRMGKRSHQCPNNSAIVCYFLPF